MGKSKDRGGGGHKGTQSRGSNVEVEEREAGSGDEEDFEEMRNPLLDSLIDAVDKLSEKRSSTRVAGLASLVKILRSPGCSDEVMTSFNGYNETISPWLKKGLKANAPEKEGVLCAQLVALMALVQDRTQAPRGNNVFFLFTRIRRGFPSGRVAGFFDGALRRAWSVSNDHAHVDRRAAPGRNPGRRHPGKPHRGV